MKDDETILVRTEDSTVTRMGGPQELKVGVLAENVNLFLTQVEKMLDSAPDKLGKFRFTEIVVSAEVSANGKLVLLGSGVEAAAKGGLSFKFQRSV